MITTNFVRNNGKCKCCTGRGVCEGNARMIEDELMRNLAPAGTANVRLLDLPRMTFNRDEADPVPQADHDETVRDSHGVEVLLMPSMHFDRPEQNAAKAKVKPKPSCSSDYMNTLPKMNCDD